MPLLIKPTKLDWRSYGRGKAADLSPPVIERRYEKSLHQSRSLIFFPCLIQCVKPPLPSPVIASSLHLFRASYFSAPSLNFIIAPRPILAPTRSLLLTPQRQVPKQKVGNESPARAENARPDHKMPLIKSPPLPPFFPAELKNEEYAINQPTQHHQNVASFFSLPTPFHQAFVQQKSCSPSTVRVMVCGLRLTTSLNPDLI